MLNGLIAPDLYYDREFTEQKLNTYIGHRFETICESYLKEEFYNGKMPFFAEEVGRWWGNNPVLKKQEEIDILAIDEESAVICECKYTNEPFDEKELDDLNDSALCVRKPNKSFIIFSKNGVTSGVQKRIDGDTNYRIVKLEDLM